MKMGWVGQVTYMAKDRNANILFRNLKARDHLGNLGTEVSITLWNLKEIEFEDVGWIQLGSG
jgi:hypothetical protein